jgi:hypothetical protein
MPMCAQSSTAVRLALRPSAARIFTASGVVAPSGYGLIIGLAQGSDGMNLLQIAMSDPARAVRGGGERFEPATSRSAS